MNVHKSNIMEYGIMEYGSTPYLPEHSNAMTYLAHVIIADEHTSVVLVWLHII